MANENFNEHFKSIFEVHGQVPTKGLINTQENSRKFGCRILHSAGQIGSRVSLPTVARHRSRLYILWC